MVEHSSLRLRFRLMREDQNYNSIYTLEEFVRSCHAKVEDEIVFPALRNLLSLQDKQRVIADVLSRLEADHKLIDAIGEQVRQRTIQGDSQTLSKRISLYCTTVETHNTAEEVQLFSYWSPDFTQEKEMAEKALKIIGLFGLNRYYEITGISDELLKKLCADR